ncbi:MAG TPA: GNAT family N-acetyltransferase, partial [Rhizobiaceae bacterium]|nr:GNAT family N-acetyltransferase [Rhizobiaceae bacterium]
MVDAAVPVRELRSARAEAGTGTAFSPVWAISYGDGEAFAGYRRLADDAVVSPTQTAGWVSAWVENVRPECIFATARIAGMPVMGLALEIVAQGPFRIARFMGDSHACGNFPPVLRGFPAERNAEVMQSLVQALKEARPDIDMLSLERLSDEIDGVRNPLLALPSLPSPNVALAVRLDGGFDELLKRASGKRKKKKHRWQMRKFEAAGLFRRFEAKTPEEVERILEAFFTMKETRLRK